SQEYPQLRSSDKDVRNILSIFFSYLAGDITSPRYKLSREGREIFQSKFDSYHPRLKQELTDLAQKVWNLKPLINL
ncbi:hypothetical protein HYU21_02150, partial [Candidatus Woesearchaeota archaeon]|nr:hypothetical protein [Candidatus Woesearchaeota archaeon]